MTEKYLVKDPAGFLYQYTKYISGNCTRKNLSIGEKTAKRISIQRYEDDLKRMTVLSKF